MATIGRASACLGLALALALLAPGCAAARPSPPAAARPLARLLLQQMNVTASRVNATIAASNASGTITRIDRLQLRKCQWDERSRSCQLNAAFALSTDIQAPSEYGGWVLAGAWGVVCGRRRPTLPPCTQAA